jgi:hypothetical protein
MDKWKGYKAYKVFRDAFGELLPKPQGVAFREGVLCGYYDTDTAAGLGFLKGDSMGLRLENFEGIDGRVK